MVNVINETTNLAKIFFYEEAQYFLRNIYIHDHNYQKSSHPLVTRSLLFL